MSLCGEVVFVVSVTDVGVVCKIESAACGPEKPPESPRLASHLGPLRAGARRDTELATGPLQGIERECGIGRAPSSLPQRASGQLPSTVLSQRDTVPAAEGIVSFLSGHVKKKKKKAIK